MASVQLYNGMWGTSPKIPVTFSYAYRRNGANMEYQVTVKVGVMTGSSSYFGYNIETIVKINGNIAGSTMLKDNSPNTWSSPLTYTTSWTSISTIGGTVPLKIHMCTNAPRGESVYNYDLYVIPMSTMSFPSSMTLGSAVKFTITKASSSYLHSIDWTIGSRTGHICSMTSESTISWTPTDDNLQFSKNLASSATSSNITFTLYTYAGALELARKSYTANMRIPDYKPVVDEVTITLDNSINSVINGWEVAVKGYTKFKWTISAHTYYNSTIPNDNYMLMGLASSTLTGASGTTEIIDSAGKKTPSAAVTDSRSKLSDTKTADVISVYNYAAPKITLATAYRCTEDGSASPSGTYLYVKCLGEVGNSIGGRNSVTAACKTKPNITNGTYSAITLGSDGSAIVSGYDVKYSYEVLFTVTDTVGTPVTRSIIIPTGSVTFALQAGGKAAGFGKYPEETTIEDTISGNKTTVKEILDSDWPVVAPYAILDGYKAGANIMAFDYTIIAVSVEPETSKKICGVTLTRPGHYICIGSIDRTTANGTTICSSFFRSDAGDKNQGALYGKTCRSTAQSGGGVMTMGFLNVTSCDADNPVSLELGTYNYDSVTCDFRGLMVCFRVD